MEKQLSVASRQLESLSLNPVTILNGIQEFTTDSARFFHKCAKPDEKEFMKIFKATMLGFFVLGMCGFVIKLIFIPINNLFLGF